VRIRPQYWLPFIIFLVSFCLHLSFISKGPVTVDCLSLAINSQATLETHQLHYQWGSGYPLMVLLGAAFISIGKFFGVTDPVIAVNFISVLFSSIAIPAFYLLVLRICDDLTAILAAVILLLNPIFLDVSTYGVGHAPALCFLLLGLSSLLRFQDTGNIADLFLSAIYLGFMGATRLQDFIVITPAIGYLLLTGRELGSSRNIKQDCRHILTYITTIILIILLFHLPYFINDHANYAIQARNYWEKSITKDFSGLFSHFLISKRSHLTEAFNIAGIICFCAGLLRTFLLNKKLSFFIAIWLIVPLSFFNNINLTVPRFFNILLPAIIIPISIFLAYLLKHKGILSKLIGAVSFLAISLQPFSNSQEILLRRHEHALIADYYLWVGRSTEADATIISSDDELFITYYSKRKIIARPISTITHLSVKELATFKERLDNILNKHTPLYITNFGFTSYDNYHEFGAFMTQNYRLINTGQAPLELWYESPYNSNLHMSSLVKIEKKSPQQHHYCGDFVSLK